MKTIFDKMSLDKIPHDCWSILCSGEGGGGGGLTIMAYARVFSLPDYYLGGGVHPGNEGDRLLAMPTPLFGLAAAPGMVLWCLDLNMVYKVSLIIF